MVRDGQNDSIYLVVMVENCINLYKILFFGHVQ